MPYPEPRFPVRIWDGLTTNPDRVTVHSNVNPDAEDWERIATEVISTQENGGNALLAVVTETGPLVISDKAGVSYPITTPSTVLVNANSAPITISLPAASTFTGNLLRLKKIDSSVNAVTIDGFSTETIDGDETKQLTSQYEAITIISDGTAWYIL